MVRSKTKTPIFKTRKRSPTKRVARNFLSQQLSQQNNKIGNYQLKNKKKLNDCIFSYFSG